MNNELKKTLLSIPGIGPAKINQLITMGLKSASELVLPHYQTILSEETKLALLYPVVSVGWDQASDIAEFLIKNKCGEKVVGSIRRRRPIVNDIDIITVKPLDDIHKILQSLRTSAFKYIGCYVSGVQRLSIVIRWRDKYVHVDIFKVSPDEMPFSMLHFTGPYEFNIGMRKKAIEKNMKLNQHGLYDESGKSIACKTERDIFGILNMVYKSPLIRDSKSAIQIRNES